VSANFYYNVFRYRSLAKHLKLARLGENFAKTYLELNNYIVIEQNWTVPFGELDLIAQDGRSLVFIEVKTRNAKNLKTASFFDQLNLKKFQKLQLLGKLYARQMRPYLKERRLINLRWEIIGIEVNNPKIPSGFRLRHFVEI
jgi:putative endonuclease